MRCVTRLESAVLLGVLFLAACSAQVGPSDKAIARVVRGLGFPCEGAIGTEALGASNKSWRVTCANTQRYLAVVQDNGNMCIEPLLLGDVFAPARQVSLPQHCAAL